MSDVHLSDFEKAFSSARKTTEKKLGKGKGGEGLFQWKSPKSGKVGLYSTRVKKEGLPSVSQIKTMKAKGLVIGSDAAPVESIVNSSPVVHPDIASIPSTPAAATSADNADGVENAPGIGGLFGRLGLAALFTGAGAALVAKFASKTATAAKVGKVGKAAPIKPAQLSAGTRAIHPRMQIGAGAPKVINLGAGAIPLGAGAAKGIPASQAPSKKAVSAATAPKGIMVKGVEWTTTPGAPKISSQERLAAAIAQRASSKAKAAGTTGTAGESTGQVTGGETPTTHQVIQEATGAAPPPQKVIVRKTKVKDVSPAVGVAASAPVRKNAGASASPKTVLEPSGGSIGATSARSEIIHGVKIRLTPEEIKRADIIDKSLSSPGKISPAVIKEHAEAVYARHMAEQKLTPATTTTPTGPAPAATPEQQVARSIITEGKVASAPAPHNPAPSSSDGLQAAIRRAMGHVEVEPQPIAASDAPREAPLGRGKMPAPPASGNWYGSLKSVSAPSSQLFEAAEHAGTGRMGLFDERTIRENVRKISLSGDLPDIAGNLRARGLGQAADVVRDEAIKTYGLGAKNLLIQKEFEAITNKELTTGLKQRQLKDFERAIDTGRHTIDTLPVPVALAHQKVKTLELYGLGETNSAAAARVKLADLIHEHNIDLVPAHDPVFDRRRDTGVASTAKFAPGTLSEAADELIYKGTPELIEPKTIQRYGARQRAGLPRVPLAEQARVTETLGKAKTGAPLASESLREQVTAARLENAALLASKESRGIAKAAEAIERAKKLKGRGGAGTVAAILGGMFASSLADRLKRD